MLLARTYDGYESQGSTDKDDADVDHFDVRENHGGRKKGQLFDGESQDSGGIADDEEDDFELGDSKSRSRVTRKRHAKEAVPNDVAMDGKWIKLPVFH
jgi:hypothetical protein